ncbi:hypothetical protein G6F56_005089 [Rhizopus delemar]|nr:hypothetical protein G6F56_005089 [Rhizopus delemar]
MSLKDKSVIINNRPIPPFILQKIFSYLPVPALVHAALVSTQFKRWIYDNVVWNDKWNILLKNDTGSLTALTGTNETIDTRDKIYIDSTPLQTLIPGIEKVKDIRERFMKVYKSMLPYYVGLRDEEGNKMLKEYKEQPEICGQMINLLIGLGQCHITEDWKELNGAVDRLSQLFQNTAIEAFKVAHESQDTDNMRIYANALIMLNGGSMCVNNFIEQHALFDKDSIKPADNFVLKEQSNLISKTFPRKMDVFHIFADRVFEDVVTDYVSHILEKAMQINVKLYLKTMSVVLDSSRQVVVALTTDDSLSEKMDADRGMNLLFKLFLPFLDDYLHEESRYAEKVARAHIEEWNNRSARIDTSARLTNQSRETFKRNYLNAFKKVITLPVDLVSSAATTIAIPFQRSFSFSYKPSASISIAPSSENKEATVELKSAIQELDMLQDHLSLEISLQLIHSNKESEKRMENFIDIGFPGRMKIDIQKTYEQIFTQLLKTLGTSHIQPGFESAMVQLSSFQPNHDNPSQDVPPLTELFELVHVADVIQQMVQLYYDEEITKHIDSLDFLHDVNKEKKVFERLLDDCVARGIDRGIQVLLSQVEFILNHEQNKEDYNPPAGRFPELRPTKACLDSIEFLRQNTNMLAGASEKGTMNLFFDEICRRFFEILCKHLKTQTVNEQGGFRYMSDMNAYYSFIVSLGQKDCTPCFLALKSLANIYIIESASDIKSIIHDLERYHGLMRVEDLFEFAACRSDWQTIKRVVQKDMTDCSIM